MEFSEGRRLGILCSYSEILVYLPLLCKSLHSSGMRAINRDHKDSENCIFLFLYYFRLWSCKHSRTLKNPTNFQYLKVQVSMPKCMLCVLPYFSSADQLFHFKHQTFVLHHGNSFSWSLLITQAVSLTSLKPMCKNGAPSSSLTNCKYLLFNVTWRSQWLVYVTKSLGLG